MGIARGNHSSGPNRSDAGGGGFHRVRGRRPAADSGAVRKARDGPKSDGRADDLSAAASEFRWSDSADFRKLAADFSADFGAVFSEQVHGVRQVREHDQVG